MDQIERLSANVNRFVEYTLFGLGLTMAIIVGIQVFFRYVLNHSIFWSEEMARFMLVWLTFLGASVAYSRGVHPSIEIVNKLLHMKVKKVNAILIHLLALAFFIIMLIYGCRFSYFIRLQISPALSIPKWIPYSIIPLSGAIMALHALNLLLQEVRKWRNDY